MKAFIAALLCVAALAGCAPKIAAAPDYGPVRDRADQAQQDLDQEKSNTR
jgi:hypothetical protein